MSPQSEPKTQHELMKELHEAETKSLATLSKEFAEAGIMTKGHVGSWNNFDGDDTRQWTMQNYCRSTNVQDAKEWINKEFKIKYWLVWAITLIDKETGELVDTYRSVIIQPDKTAIGFVSEGIVRSLQLLVAQFGDKMLEDPVTVILKSISLADGKNFYRLEPIGFDF